MYDQFQFKKDCSNNICNTDLHLSSQPNYQSSDGALIIGTPDLSVDVSISKTRDPSYGSMFYMVVPSFLQYVRMQTLLGEGISCYMLAKGQQGSHDVAFDWQEFLQRTNYSVNNDTEIIMQCNFGNPMYSDQGVRMNIFFRLPDIIELESFKLVLFATTQSNEVFDLDNKAIIDIKLKHVYTTTLTG